MKNSKKIFPPLNLCLAGFMSVCSAFMVSAEILSPAEALARMYGENANTPAKVRGEFKQFSPDDLVAVVESSSAPCAYVVSGDAGYAVVSADSRSVPLLGYGDHTIDSKSSIPPAMLWWIRHYAEEFSDMPEDAVCAGAGNRAANALCTVDPLCSTRWGQGDPYNLFCPEQNGKKTWVGCVATSMAQIMRHFNWPERGTGHHSYTWNDTEIALDFSEQEFRWDLMLPDYKTGYSQEQADAVARLSYACGVAVDMNYGLGGSGAEGEEQAHALTTYFDYGKSTTLLDRSDFYTSDWERMMHESLMAGAPVAYMGFANGGGHAFLLDGYDGEGFFHFNWGWTGDADGYFRMSSLNPYEESLPGYVYGYNRDQKAVVYALPSSVRDSPLVVMSNRGHLEARWDNEREEAVFHGKFTYFGSAASEVRLGVMVVGGNGNVVVVSCSVSELQPMGEILEFSVLLPELAPGGYMVSPAYYDGAEWQKMSTSIGNPDALAMMVGDDGVCFQQKNVNPLTLVSMKQNTPFYMGYPFEIEFELRNDNAFEHAMAYQVAIINGAGRLVWNYNQEVAYLSPGESAVVKYQEALPFFSGFGMYQVALAYLDGEEVRYIGAPSDFIMENVPRGFSFEGAEVTLSEIGESAHQYRLDYAIHCVEGFYCYRLRYAVFDSEGNIVLRKATADRDFVCDGETGSFCRNLNLGSLEDGSYTIRLYASVSAFEEDVIDDPYLPFLGEVDFSVEDSGVASLDLDGGKVYVENGRLHAPQGSRIFNLQGIELPVSSVLDPGIYIVSDGSRSLKLTVD